MNALLRLSLGLLLVWPCLAGAATYRWVDKAGQVHYTETPPPLDAVRGEEKRLRSNVIDTTGDPYAVQKAAKDFPVTLHTGKDCGPPCGNGRALLKRRGVPFSEAAVVTDKDGEAFRKRFGEGPIMVPMLTIGGQVLRGFEEGAWNVALDEAGYPRSAVSNSGPATKPDAPKGDTPAATPRKP